MNDSHPSLCSDQCVPGKHIHICQLQDCGEVFEAARSFAKYCSPSHAARAAALAKPKASCAHPGCPNNAMPGLPSGYCQSHHRRSIAGKDMDAPLKGRPGPRQRPEEARQCIHVGCDRLRVSKGLCESHAARRDAGKPLDKECSWWNCDEIAVGDGKCRAHFAGRGRHGDGIELCSVVDPDGTMCSSRMRSNGLCNTHYMRWRQTGDPGQVGLLRKAAGEGHQNDRGYVVIQANGHRKMRSHLVIEAETGMEVDTLLYEVDHKNGIRNDDEFSNLELKPIGHGAGQHLENLVPFLVDRHWDLIELYRRDGNCDAFPSWARKK